MNVLGVTSQHVASHLQKFRIRRERKDLKKKTVSVQIEAQFEKDLARQRKRGERAEENSA